MSFIYPILFFFYPFWDYDKTMIQTHTQFDRLNESLKSYVSEGKVAGISALIQKGDRIIYSENFGYKNLNSKTPVDDNTLFRLASLTKPVISIAILKLVSSGELQLEDKLIEHIPAFRGSILYNSDRKIGHNITIADLLRHTSGISSPLMDDIHSQQYLGLHQRGDINNLNGWVEALSHIPLAHETNQSFSYGYSTDVLARVIEVVTEMPLDEYLRQEIFEPLSMKSTFYRVPENLKSEAASVYLKDEANELIPIEDYDERVSQFPRGNTGLISTIRDYVRFASFVMNQGEVDGIRLIDEKLMAQLYENKLPQKILPLKVGSTVWDGLGFSYGFFVSMSPNSMAQVPGTIGWIGATHTYFFIDPENQIIGLAFTQHQGFGTLDLPWTFNSLVYEALKLDK